ncbi:MAG: hypothetical protein J6Z49_05680 [Kiritimatiellae bacterium]|nr:hypothetical protein [Kiritimatiellia bacterium]
MNISILNKGAEAPVLGAPGTQPQEAAAGKPVAPLLGGKNVTVTSAGIGDLEKLLMQLRAESAEKRSQLASIKLSGALEQLVAKNAIEQSESNAMQLLALKIEELDAAIERETTTLEERKTQLETARRLKEEADEKAAAKEESAVEESEATVEKEVETKETETEISEEAAVPTEEEIAALEKAVTESEAMIASLQSNVKATREELQNHIGKLDFKAMQTLSDAIRISASDATAAQEITLDAKDKDDEEAKKAIPVEIIRESIEKVLEDLREEILERRDTRV